MLMGHSSNIRQYLDESDPNFPFLVVWDPKKLSASLTSPEDINPKYERFEKVKTGGHKMWISSRGRISLEVQGRALDLAIRGYRVFIIPPINFVLLPNVFKFKII